MTTTVTFHHEGLEFHALSAGAGAGDGPVVVLLHGFPDHAASFRPLVEHLAASGYHAVAPALRGYEPSSQASGRGDYAIAALAGDVLACLDYLGVDAAHVVGHDWGATVAYAAATLAPDRVRSVVGVAVPPIAPDFRPSLGLVGAQLRKSWYMGFFQLPALPERALRRDDWALVRRLWRTWSPGFELPGDEWRALVATLSAPGVVPAALAYYRHNLRRPQALRRLTQVPQVPTLVVTGADDGCVDTRLYDGLTPTDALAVRRIEGAGHWLHLERPDEFAGFLLDWLAAH